MPSLLPKLTATPFSPPTYNPGMAETFSWVPIEGADRPLFDRAGYITNLSDLQISLSKNKKLQCSKKGFLFLVSQY